MVMWKKYRYIGLFFLAAIIMAGCAKVMPLTGGDEDKEPPKFRSADPDTFALNFTGKTITIKFDEYINLVDPTREIILSPPVEPAPEFSASGQSVKIRFKEPLRPNVTYVINFGESIQDITEANKNQGFTFVFSTGSFIDSGQVSGNVNDAFSGQPSEGYKVMLYNTDVSDSFPYKEKPFYLAYTDKAGSFKLSNLRKGNYNIFVLQEDNNNFIFDRGGEKIGFINGIVSTEDSTPVKIVTFAEEGSLTKFNKPKSISSVRTDFYFSGDAEQVKITPFKGIPDSNYIAHEFNKTRDTVTVWHRPVDADTIGFYITIGSTQDTAIFKVNKGPQPNVSTGRKSRSAAVVSSMQFDASGNPKFDLYSMPTFTMAEPVRQIDTSRMKLLMDSVPQKFTVLADTSSPRKYKLNFQRVPNKKYILICDSAAFVSISGKVSTKSTYSFGFREAVEYASIKVNYEDSILKFPKIWQLLKEDKVIRETFAPANRKDVEFSRLEPGSYRLRLILDENANRRWDTGKFIDKKQPERVLYLAETIELKAGWDSEITWKIKKPGRGK